LAWQIFEQAASRYEAWYRTKRGRRADIAESALLEWLLRQLPDARTVLEVGSGTGHFAARMAESGFQVIGLERAPAMAKEAQRNFPSIPFAVGDAHNLPLREEVVDVVAFITTLEFLECPVAALREAVRRRSSWSSGGCSEPVEFGCVVPAVRLAIARSAFKTGERLFSRWTAARTEGGGGRSFS